jgi:hypothetical protein
VSGEFCILRLLDDRKHPGGARAMNPNQSLQSPIVPIAAGLSMLWGGSCINSDSTPDGQIITFLYLPELRRGF